MPFHKWSPFLYWRPLGGSDHTLELERAAHFWSKISSREVGRSCKMTNPQNADFGPKQEQKTIAQITGAKSGLGMP